MMARHGLRVAVILGVALFCIPREASAQSIRLTHDYGLPAGGYVPGGTWDQPGVPGGGYTPGGGYWDRVDDDMSDDILQIGGEWFRIVPGDDDDDVISPDWSIEPDFGIGLPSHRAYAIPWWDQPAYPDLDPEGIAEPDFAGDDNSSDDGSIGVPQFGSCCLPDGACMVSTDAACSAFFGEFHGAGTTCEVGPLCSFEPAPVGACCMGGEECREASEMQCEVLGGLFDGEGSSCKASGCGE